MDKILEKSSTELHSRWVEHLSRVENCALRIFCFPYAGGNTQIYRSLQKLFPADIDVCLVQLPGRGKRIAEKPFTRLTHMVEVMAEGLFEGSSSPFVFFGHSMGAMISFELARFLRRKGLPGPRHLFLSGRRAPTIPEDEGPTFDLPHDKFIAELRRLNGTPPELLELPEAMELFLPMLRADFEVVDTYVCESEEPLSCPITVYSGLQDKSTTREAVIEWEKQTTAAFRCRMLPGDHFFVQDPRSGFFPALAKDVLTTLQAVNDEGPAHH